MTARFTTFLLAPLFLILVAPDVAHATEWVKVSNQSKGTVRVKVWRGLNSKTKTLKRNQHFFWKRNNTKSYSVRVFKKQGRLIKTWKVKSTKKGVDYSSDVVIRKSHTITVTRPRHLVLKNASDRAIVVRLYKGKDDVRLIALKSFTIQPGKSVTYRSVVEKFNVKVFELRDGFNRHLATRTDVPRPATVTIDDRDGWTVGVRK